MRWTALRRAKRNRQKKKQNQKKLKDNQRTKQKLRKLPKIINEPPFEEKNVKHKKGKEQKPKQKEKEINKKPPQKNSPPPQVANKPSGTAPHSFRIEHHNLCRHLKASFRNIQNYKRALIKIKMKLRLEKCKYEKKLILLKEKNDELQGQERKFGVAMQVLYSKSGKANGEQLIAAETSEQKKVAQKLKVQ